MTSGTIYIYQKRDKAPKLKTLPPTDENLALHVLRAHLQAMIWNAVDQDGPPDVNIENYGWEIKNCMSLPVAYNGPPAPPSIMKVIVCGCNLSRCATNACSCRVAKASCTPYCKCDAGDDCKNELTVHEDMLDHSDSDVEKFSYLH